MKSPEFPENEKERLLDLQSLNVLDTAPEERFDRLTRMAKRMFGVDIALVSLVDENRQWFKSKAGLDAGETGRDISFCGHAILGSDIFVIEDTLGDERFHDNPLVTGPPNIRFYAGAPLRYMNGSKLGTLCIIDSEPRSFGDDDRVMLDDLAQMAENELHAIHLATIDELTKISNRRGFTALAHTSLSLCVRQRSSVSLVFFDLDHFKPINDRHGHAEGDRVLVSFANLMRKTFRDSDVLARIGGDEFAVLLTNTGKKRAAKIVGRFRDLVDNFNAEADREYDIEFSDGIVSIKPDKECSIEGLLHDADLLMYETKMEHTQPLEPLKQA